MKMPIHRLRETFGLVLCFYLALAPAFGADTPGADVQSLHTPRTFPEINTLAQWQERSRTIREQILVSAGLWPMPEKTLLHAVISGKIVRDGYSVERVYFQSCPGFYVGGNLYRPLGKGAGPFPAILDAHGHWVHGRLEDTDNCSAPGRCINFAKQGMIAFAYDMVGYNDTRFAETPPNTNTGDLRPGHSFGTNNPANLLWSVTLMGLQTWNSIRALDFLESLPDADKTKLAMTGASGGGTQTFLLGAIDDRLAAQAPVNMVSHTMQGGCQCENMPGLRVEFSNMEIDAAAAPRPQILVSATGDWTKSMLTTEGPAIGHIYQLFQDSENLRYVQFDFPHNYNKASREAVYQWFDRSLLHQPDQTVAEQAFKKEPDSDLLAFPDGKLPRGALSEKELIDYLIKMHRDQLQRINTTDGPSLANYKRIIEPAWKWTLQLKWPMSAMEAEYISVEAGLGRHDEDKTHKWMFFAPVKSGSARKPDIIVLAHPEGKKDYVDNAGDPIGLARQFLDKGFDVVVVAYPARPANPAQTSILFTTYNRTRLQERVRDLVSICQGVKDLHAPDTRRVVLCGCGRAGLWSLLAAPAADAVVADCCQLDVSDDQSLVDPDLFCPGIRNIGTFTGALILAAPHPLALFNVAPGFETSDLRSCYRGLHAEMKVRVESRSLKDDEIVAAVLSLRQGETLSNPDFLP
jgi:dienelactone hydrolase